LKTVQEHFGEILFHSIKIQPDTIVAREKNFFFTRFTQRKWVLWKTCGLQFQLGDPSEAGLRFAQQKLDTGY